MGTRGAWGFVIDGAEKITYNHCDSYPDGLGVAVLRALRLALLDGRPLVDRARALRAVTDNDEPTPEDIERLRGFANTSVGTKRLDDWYVLLRETQGDFKATLDAGVMLDGAAFPLDSLYCEFAYVVDLDANEFQAYVGFQHEPPTAGRWVGKEAPPYHAGIGPYYPSQMVGSWPVSDLPTDAEFYAAFESGEE